MPSYAFGCFRLLPCVSPPSDRKPILLLLLLLLAWCDVERGSSKSFFAMIDDLLRPVSKGEKISSSPSVKKSLPIVDVASKVFLKSSGKRLAFSSRFSAVVVALEKPRSLEVSFFRRAELDTSRYYGAEESITFRALCFEKTSTLFPTKTAL